MNETLASEESQDVIEQDNENQQHQEAIENNVETIEQVDVAVASSLEAETVNNVGGLSSTLSDDDEGTTDPVTEPTTEPMVDESIISASESVPNDLYESKIEDEPQVYLLKCLLYTFLRYCFFSPKAQTFFFIVVCKETSYIFYVKLFIKIQLILIFKFKSETFSQLFYRRKLFSIIKA